MKNKNTILWCVLIVAVAALLTTAILCWGTLKSSLGLGTDAPANVRSEDMSALFQGEKIDEDKLAAYSVVWEDNLHAAIEKGKEQNSDLAVADLKSEVEKATAVVDKLNAVMSLVSEANRTTINTATLKAQSDLESAKRFIDSHGSVAKPATPQSSAQTGAAPAATGQYVVVTGDGVRLRTGPGFGYDVYTHVNHGKTIPYVSTSGDWFCVNYKGRTLYISNEFAYVGGSSSSNSTTSASSSTTSSSSSGSYVVINGNGVRLRTGPGEDYSIYTKLNKGARVPYVSTSGDWFCVNYNGRTLYVSAQYSYIN